MNDELNKTVINTFKIIDVIANAKDSVGISNLSVAVSLPKTTVFRLISTLKYLNIIFEDKDKKYSLGSTFLKYVNRVKSKNSLVEIALPFMNQFSKKIKETINLGILYNSQVVYLKSIEGENFSLQVKLMPVAPLYCSSMGKIFLATFSEKQLTHYFATCNLDKKTVNTINNETVLRKEVLAVKKEKIAYDNEEAEYGLSCIAVPITKCNKVVAAISVSGPTSRIQVRGLKQIKMELKNTAQKIIKSLHEENIDDLYINEADF